MNDTGETPNFGGYGFGVSPFCAFKYFLYQVVIQNFVDAHNCPQDAL